jgi:hypothetical protein
MPSYTALYRSRSGEKLVVRSLSPLPEKRKFKVAGGLRTFTKVREKYHLQEVIIVAKSAKATKNKKSAEVEDSELDELEGLEELDELEEEDEDVEDEEEPDDEDEDEDEDDDDEDDDEEEEVAPKKSKKTSKPRQSRAAADGLVGTQEVADFCGVSSRELRMVLRKLREKDSKFAPDSETGRYQWKSLKDKQVVALKKAIDKGLHKEIRAASLEKLKADQAEKKAAKDARSKTTTKKDKKKKKKAVVEDDDE